MTRGKLSDPDREFIGPYAPIGAYGPYPERLRQQFEGVIWPFRTGGQGREMPTEFGAWPTVHNRFRQWRDAGVFEVPEAGRPARSTSPPTASAARWSSS